MQNPNIYSEIHNNVKQILINNFSTFDTSALDSDTIQQFKSFCKNKIDEHQKTNSFTDKLYCLFYSKYYANYHTKKTI